MNHPKSFTNRLLVLRCDSTAAIGAGHVMRCLALGEVWQGYGGRVVLAGQIESQNLRKRISTVGLEHIPLNDQISLDDTLNLLHDLLLAHRALTQEANGQSWLILDGYHFTTTYQRAVREQGYRLCVIDDTAHLAAYDTDVLLNQNIGADQLPYQFISATHKLLGLKYVILRSQFLAWGEIERTFPDQVTNILITFGGVDMKNQIPKTLRAIQSIKPRLALKVVLGFDYTETDEFKQALDEAKELHQIELLCGVDDMPNLMAWADLAISASGSTVHELAFMGVPMILIAIAQNQLGILQGLHEQGAAVSLGWYEQVTETTIAREVFIRCDDASLCRDMSQASRKLIDGLGRERIVQTLVQQTSTDKGKLW